MEIRRLDSTRDDFDTQLNELLAWDISADSEIEQVVRGVIADIQQRGDVALLEYTAQFDGHRAAGYRL
ncbi:MAG: hypothetical protein RIC89_03085 [Pseudomonadales bacterium]